MTGRTVKKHIKAYIDGYDLSGDVMSVGPLSVKHDAELIAGLDWDVKSGLPGRAEVTIGTVNTILHTKATTDAGHNVLPTRQGDQVVVMIPVGMRADPVQGDPAFIGWFDMGGYMSNMDQDIVTVSVPLDKWSVDSGILSYSKVWGKLLHAKSAVTTANSAVGIDDNGASSSAGGWLQWQIFAVEGTGNVTIKVQEATTNSDGDFGDLTGATSGAIAHTAIPAAGIVQLSTTAAVKRYLRWQVVLDGITSATFALTFVRG